MGFRESSLGVTGKGDKQIVSKDMLSPVTGKSGGVRGGERFIEMGLFPAFVGQMEETKV